ncbi:unnamed protein product [Kuraishia capsulata CBS 1993]|uniref:Uncharacterized protein n=1 Tax=Kuraishia capsulata CBS 1993 TaxID=1382522 RepID=W6MM53_9ASCO|nr:uncharacterized protein KUCA_T00003246001 [Kuraishia capsulata CBS 1993]CDK27268.1 unnamed protein product [Kuraishia capsulata CBS 1993]
MQLALGKSTSQTNSQQELPANNFENFTEMYYTQLFRGPSYRTYSEWREYNQKKIDGPLGEVLWRRERFTGTLEEKYSKKDGFDFDALTNDTIWGELFPNVEKRRLVRVSLANMFIRVGKLLSRQKPSCQQQNRRAWGLNPFSKLAGVAKGYSQALASAENRMTMMSHLPSGSSVYSNNDSVDQENSYHTALSGIAADEDNNLNFETADFNGLWQETGDAALRQVSQERLNVLKTTPHEKPSLANRWEPSLEEPTEPLLLISFDKPRFQRNNFRHSSLEDTPDATDRLIAGIYMLLQD